MYRIYNPITKLYANGGVYNDWSKNGKVFTTMGSLKKHLTSIKKYSYSKIERYISDECKVINVLTNEEFPVKLLIDNPENF